MEIKKEVKRKFLLDIHNHISNGLNPTKISQKLNISKQKLNYYLKTLKDSGLIRKIGYGTWEVKEVKKSTKDAFIQGESPTKIKEVRGHAFIWKIKLPKEIRGYNSLSRLNSKNIKYKLVGIKETPRIICLTKKVWLGTTNIIIYDSCSYLSTTSLESRKLAVSRMLQIVHELEKSLGITLKSPIGYIFKPNREHYSLIKNDLAIQYNHEGKKLNIQYYGETWFLIDNSYNLNEAETVHKDSAMTDNLGVQKFFNELKESNFEATPQFLMKAINQVVQNQMFHAENMVSHVKAVQDLGDGVNELRQAVQTLTKVVKHQNIKDDNLTN